MNKQSATLQFIAQVRQVRDARRAELQQEYSLYCPCCHMYTFHTLDPQGSWEHYFCQKCGNQKSYKVG